MGKLFARFGKNKKEEEAELVPEPEPEVPPPVEEPVVVVEEVVVPEMPAITETDNKVDAVCSNNENGHDTNTANTITEDNNSNYWLGDGTYDTRIAISLGITAVSSTLVLVLVAYNMLFRRKQRRIRRMWKSDSQRILLKVDDLVQQLEERDEEVDILEQKIKTQQQQALQDKEQLEHETTHKIQTQQEEYQTLLAAMEDLKTQHKETEAQLEHVTMELKQHVEQQQDHECQMLEQKLQASQISNILAEREAQLEELQRVATTQSERIQELQHKIKADSVKAEKIINELTSERDDRFSILQQENDAIKTTIMGLLQQTQEKYDADKVLLKKELRNRDEKIRNLQEELWKSNALLKRLQQDSAIKAKMSQSVRHLISEKETQEDAVSAEDKEKERRSSTFEVAETILEGDTECAELKELQKMLQT